jgi:hypothetical protein
MVGRFALKKADATSRKGLLEVQMLKTVKARKRANY